MYIYIYIYIYYPHQQNKKPQQYTKHNKKTNKDIVCSFITAWCYLYRWERTTTHGKITNYVGFQNKKYILQAVVKSLDTSGPTTEQPGDGEGGERSGGDGRTGDKRNLRKRTPREKEGNTKT